MPGNRWNPHPGGRICGGHALGAGRYFPHSAIFDSMATMVVGGNLRKALTWCDNGRGYANRVIERIHRMAALTLGR
jgi:hypothetical protein